MEELFKQSFNYAVIKVFKNYSDRITRNLKPETIEVYGDVTEIDMLQEPVKKYTVTAMARPVTYDLRLYLKGKKKTNFFYTTQPTDSFENHAIANHPVVEYEGIDLINPATSLKNKEKDYFETTKDRHIKAHYNNPFASIEVIKIERWIKKDGDKITMKMFMQSRNRNLNNIYFAKSTSSTTITFNLRTGNFTIVTFTSGRKSKMKHFYCNSFNALKQSLHVFYKIKEGTVNKSSSVYKEYVDTFDTIQFQFAIKSALSLGEISFGATADILSANFVDRWMTRFVEIKKIKVPDKGERLLQWYYPTERFLKKNEYKLVAAVLDRFGLKSKVTIKLLHLYPHLDLIGLSQLCQLFGDEYPKYLGNVNERFFDANSSHSINDQSGKSILLDDSRRVRYILTDYEKESIINILNDACIHNPDVPGGMTLISNYGAISTILDHFAIIERIKPYYPETSLKARKWDTFNAEHSLYSKYEREIKKGYSVEVIFESPVLQEIEKVMEVVELDKIEPIMYFENVRDRIAWERQIANTPVHAIQRVFEPKLLRSSDDYFEEGCYMNHCVAGYLENDYSIIVSLRLGKERVTCEYAVKDRRCIQAKYFHNQKPPQYFEKALKMLDDRISRIPFPIKPLDRRRVPLVINGVEVKPQADVVHTILQEAGLQVEEAVVAADNNPFPFEL